MSKDKTINDILKEAKSPHPLQDYQKEHGLDGIYKALNTDKGFTHGGGFAGHVDHIKLNEEDRQFLKTIAQQLNTYFVGNKGRGYWYDKIIFEFGHFSGYQPEIPNTAHNSFGL